MVKRILKYLIIPLSMFWFVNVHAVAPTITSTSWQYGSRYLNGTGSQIFGWETPNKLIWNNYAYPYLYSIQSTFLSTENELANQGSHVALGDNSTYYIYFDLIGTMDRTLSCKSFKYALEFFNENTDTWNKVGNITCKGMQYAYDIFTQEGYSYNGYHVVLQISLPDNFSSGYDILDITATSTAAAIQATTPYQIGITGITYDTLYDNSYLIEGQNAEIIKQQQTTNDKLEDLDNTIKDNNVDTPNFGEFDQYITENGVITQLITLPVRLYTQILNNINAACTPFELGEMFGHNLVMDCINPSNFFGSGLWNTIDILGSGLFIYAISKKMIAVFHQFTNLEEGDILD